ncbi:MAG: strawberry notch family protein [Paludibacteraceae bacterium]|nr:strawberry notch family protein [Paludibacteraceae bacterium]
MKLIEIQRHYFSIKGEKGKFFCTSADTDASLNVRVVRFVPSENLDAQEMVLRGKDLDRIIPEGLGLGMAYTPASDVRRLTTQTPDSMGYDIHEALRKLTEAVGGNVTDYVCERLQWSREEIEERLFAEQVDAVALAIYNHETRKQAMIIGDQTGIGKGRVASSLIRYAIVHNLIPVYCTENPGLFSDNYRDLTDIGYKDLKPFIVNIETNGKGDARIKTLNENDEMVVVYEPLKDKKKREDIFKSGKLPKEYGYILTTYSQLGTAFKTDKKTKDRIEGPAHSKYKWLKDIAPNAFFIFDESHNISGSKAISTKWWDSSDVELGGSNQFYCFNELSKMANGVLFLSATFAKRPENLVVYAGKTCISESGLNDVELIQAIQDGGEALQEVISSDIVAEGQMIRRESIFGEEIKVNYITLDKEGEQTFGVPDLEKEHRATCDYITSIINKINFFEQEYVMPFLNGIKAVNTDSGFDTVKTSKNLGISNDPIFSKLFMIVNQMLFSIKADAVANHAIRRLNEGKKVVIGLSSTMESFIKDMEIESDKEFDCDFACVLKKAITSCLKYRVRDKESGDTEFSYIDIAELPVDGQDYYFKLMDEIATASSGISLSPIDYIVSKIESAGFSVAEVTGRDKKVLFTNDKGTRGKIVNRKRVTRAEAFGNFQNNKVDVLVINSSGATGASAHATTKNTNLKPEEVKPRVMIIAQMELDVNKEVQKRGRINRTGQIKELPPSYDYIISAIPAEKRLMMMMQKKLRSLDANSTSNQKQSTGIIDTSDFMNKYGDRVATDFLKENQAINEKLNDPIGANKEDDNKKGEKKDVDIMKLTGHIPVLTCEEQEEFYTSIQDRYDKLVHQLVERGEYDLSVEAMDLDASQIGELRLLRGSSSGESKFSDAVYVGKFECKVLRKPYSADEIRVMMKNYMGGEHSREKAVEKASSIGNAMEQYYNDLMATYTENFNNKVQEETARIRERITIKGGAGTDVDVAIKEYREGADKKFNGQIAKLRSSKQRAGVIKFFHCGRSCVLDSMNTRAICLGTEIGNKTKNPYAQSNVSIAFAVANSQKVVEFDIQDEGYEKLMNIRAFSYGLSASADDNTLNNWLEITKESNVDKEVREIIVGNILRAYKDKPEGAKLISFTTHDGEVMKGLLVPKKLGGQSNGDKMVLSTYSLSQFLPVIKEKMRDTNESKFDLTRGTSLVINGSAWAYKTHLAFCVKDATTYKRLQGRLNDFEELEGGRTFNYYSGNQICNVQDNKIDKFISLMEELQFKVELLPSQVAEYFKDENKKLKNGNWKKVSVNKANIPAGKKTEPKAAPSPDLDRKRKLLILAKAKIKIAKAKAKANK